MKRYTGLLTALTLLGMEAPAKGKAFLGRKPAEVLKVSEEETIDLDELEDMFPDDFCGV